MVDMNRRQWLHASAGSLATIPLLRSKAAGPHVFVYKTPACACCDSWAELLRAEGFTVTVTESDVLAAVKDRLRVPPDLSACHTGIVDGYVLEGHVPAGQIKKLLVRKPAIIGIALPDGPSGGAATVTAFSADGLRVAF
jgi:hypothetical protein